MNAMQTLDDVKKAIESIKKKKSSLRAKTPVLYSSFSNDYKKHDWSQHYIETQELKKIANKSAIGVIRKARDLKKIKVIGKKDNHFYYSKMNVKGLFILQEMMCLTDDEFWTKKYRVTKKQKKKRKKIKYIPFYFDSKYLGRCYICSHPESLSWKRELVTEYLQDKHYIFDETNKFGKPLQIVRKFIEKSLIKGQVEKWDYHFHRFLTKTTK